MCYKLTEPKDKMPLLLLKVPFIGQIWKFVER